MHIKYIDGLASVFGFSLRKGFASHPRDRDSHHSPPSSPVSCLTTTHSHTPQQPSRSSLSQIASGDKSEPFAFYLTSAFVCRRTYVGSNPNYVTTQCVRFQGVRFHVAAIVIAEARALVAFARMMLVIFLALIVVVHTSWDCIKH